ncbi:MAG: glucosaminidase domain-containing protein, partial [Saprospiraceae bacterium]|nr:glucosaminidase domain-containing protein [Saprospiraceae bacterium]
IWKLAVMMALTYIIWGDQVEIRVGSFSCTIQPAGAIAGNTVHEEELGIFSGLEPATSEIPMQDWTAYHDFVHQFYPVAIAEMRQNGVPASILLAQALIRSEAGKAAHLGHTNNYFAQPCTHEFCELEHESISLANGEVVLIHTYQNQWLCFRTYCKYLKTIPAINKLILSGNNRVQEWAKTLEELNDLGVYTNANQICQIIKKLKLDQFDQRKTPDF